MNVTIYSTPVCKYCVMAKEFFKKNNVSYTEIDVSKDGDKRKEMVEKSGQLGVPVIEIGDQIVVGYEEKVLSGLLGIGGGLLQDPSEDKQCDSCQ